MTPSCAIGPSTIQGWIRQLQQRGLAEIYRRTIFANVSGVFTAALDDERIRRNPCAARSVSRPRGEYPKITPWTSERVVAVREALGERYRLALSVGAGCGLRQGEAFGLSIDDIDFDAQPPSFAGVDDTPSVISVQMGRGAPDQAECDFLKIVV